MAKPKLPTAYGDVHTGIVELLESARRAAARSVNARMTASYWEIGRRIVEFEQGGKGRAKYGETLIERLAEDLTHRFGRGFSKRNIEQMRQFYLTWPITQTLSTQSTALENPQTPSAESSPLPIRQTPSGLLPNLATLATRFPLPWSAYVRLLSVKSGAARAFYETEALRCGWSARQLDRQIGSQFYERVDLVFFHRRLRCLVIIDLKAGRFSYADAGQMHLYLNHAREHWMKPGENPPVGLNRVRIKADRFLGQQIALPRLAEQKAIVARLYTLENKARQVAEHLDAIEADAERLLAVRFREAIADAPYRPMAEVAPVVKRPVDIDLGKTYNEVGARSFGKGLFAKPAFDGADTTWQKPVWIAPGDLVLSNIKAWEEAIAVAGRMHADCIASHRYITCVPDRWLASTDFLRYYLLTDDGLEKIGRASPGTADRNRTLSITNLMAIEVPVPSLEAQQAFDTLQAKVAELKAKHAALREANAALVPATLERVFHAANPQDRDHG